MFINDIGNNLESDFLLYADDLKLFGTNPDSIAKDLVTISSWCDNWQMTVAPNKCECIRFSHMKKYAKLRPPALSIDGVCIPSTCLIRDLGVLYSSNLSFATHIDKITDIFYSSETFN
uniref:Reverse transcriptase domain-containing protein n=1 Tax=Caenorhabditis japonica TaxID=281687 RepID=A0A8R1IKF3_CAEJA